MFKEIDKKIISIMNTDGFTQEELDKFFDKKVKLPKKNKKGEELYLYRHFSSEPITVGSAYYINKAHYYIINQDGYPAGKIAATVANTLAGDKLEIEYWHQDRGNENRGNISIGLEEVIKDIFLRKQFDNLPVKENVLSNIQTIFLSIVENNIASQKVAGKAGFTKKKGELYELTLSEYLERMKKLEGLDDNR